MLAAGVIHTCAIVGGAVKCWGYNADGQLGTGDNIEANTPQDVGGLTGVIEIATGGGHSCALLDDGTAQCWGRNQDGQLGNGTSSSNTPIPVIGLSGATAIATGSDHTCALVDSGMIAGSGLRA